jgi:hypothetical protein
LRQNVLSKVVDRTDEIIAKAQAEEDQRILAKQTEETERRQKLVESLLKFNRDDQAIKSDRREQMSVDKLKEREKNLQYFDDFLRIVADKRMTKDKKEKLTRAFWDEQARELRQGRFEEKDFDRILLETEQRQDMETEDDLVNFLRL